MAELVLFIMLAALVLYAVFGGADFGVGMLDPFLPEEQRSKIDEALLPVWEANHVWFVIAAVVCFVAFPPLFGAIATYLHIPILFLLLGIVARGSAFTFRHYDPASTEQSRRYTWYSWVFSFSSVLAPMFLGVMGAAIVCGGIPDSTTRPETSSFYDLFIAPWNTALGWLTGIFTCALFAFEGAALLAAEEANHPGGPLPLLNLTRHLHALAILVGVAVLACAWLTGASWVSDFFLKPLSLLSIACSAALIPVVAWSFHRGRVWPLRFSTGAQVGAVLVGCFGAHYPVLMRFAGGRELYVAQASAPDSTLATLLIALAVGLLLIGPALGYLLWVFKRSAA